MNRKLFNKIAVIGVTATAFLATVLTSNNISLTLHASSHGSTCQWNHYEEINPTYKTHGVKEYWICCDHHELGPVFEQPKTGGTITNATHPSNFKDEITSEDARYIAPYTETITFSDGYIPAILTPNSNVSELIVNSTFELQMTVKNGSFGLFLSKHYLDEVFSDPEVVEIQFEAKSNVTTNNFRRKYYDPNKAQWTNRTYEANLTGYGITTTYKTFAYKREYYNLYKEGETFIVGGNVSLGDYIIVDNIRPSKTSLTSYGFENGALITKSVGNKYQQTTTGHSDNGYVYYEVPSVIFESSASGIFTNVTYDYTNKTEGLRSIKFTKNDGYVAFYLQSNIQSLLSEGDEVLVDIRSTKATNGNANVKNFIDGMNNPTLCEQHGRTSHPADTWMTYRFGKNQITADGRFLIIQGSSGGDWLFDNIRISKYAGEHNEGIIHVTDSDTNIKINTKYNVQKVESITLNGTKLSSGDVTIKNGKASLVKTLFADEVNKIDMVYVDGSTLYSETIYLELFHYQTRNAINLSLTYGSANYYSLSGYSGIYRMTANNLEVPYEVSGSNYLIPEASLIELLPTVDGKKTSGTVTLSVYTLTANYDIPFNITLSGGENTKTLQEFNGKGISSHAYSSTSSYSTSNDYQQYLNTGVLSEYDNTGLEIIYEQAVHVTVGDTTLRPALKYLLDNAHSIGKKVLLSEDFFSKASKSETPLIGYDLMDGESVIAHFNSEAELDAHVEFRLKMYIDHPACYGISVGDEQFYVHLVNGFKDIMASLHRVLKKLGREDFFLNVNLNPNTAALDALAGDQSSGDRETDYRTYLETYYKYSGLDYIQFDAYPFTSSDKGGNYEGLGLQKYYIQNIIEVAEFAKEKDIEFRMVGQSLMYYGTRILNRADVAWITNMMMGYGVKHISFFVYCVRKWNEEWINDSAPLTKEGDRTKMYYYYQSAVHEINQFAPVISAFEYKWCQLYRRSSVYGSSKASIYTNATDSKYYSGSSTYGEYKSIKTEYTADWTLITGLEHSSSKKMYMIQNIYNNFDNEKLQEIPITFNATYSYAVIYEAGLPRVVNMNSSKLTIKLSAGHAAYIMVY